MFVFGSKMKKTFNPWIDAWHLFVKFESSAAARDVPSANPYQLFYFIGFIIKFVRPIHAAFVFIFFILFVCRIFTTDDKLFRSKFEWQKVVVCDFGVVAHIMKQMLQFFLCLLLTSR